MIETYRHIVDPLLAAIKSDSGAIIAKLHRDPIRSTDPLADMGGSSAYVKEITERLAFVKTEILARLAIEEVTREWFVFFRVRKRSRKKTLSVQVAGHREICSQGFRVARLDRQTARRDNQATAHARHDRVRVLLGRLYVRAQGQTWRWQQWQQWRAGRRRLGIPCPPRAAPITFPRDSAPRRAKCDGGTATAHGTASYHGALFHPAAAYVAWVAGCGICALGRRTF